MEIYGLFQTDIWQTLDSYVNFGYFSTEEEARNYADDLIVEDSLVVIEEYELDVFGERNGRTVAVFEYVEEE